MFIVHLLCAWQWLGAGDTTVNEIDPLLCSALGADLKQ